ncbi:23S ribosomal RNA methyltransferase [Suhomyces tanzawaensis NRRL Y-17324]|uniref:rRNA methyltransferase 2, mitochondrial n=1 Tax=Suhomyces tanzawaensis NRRL Y-17324 TaxID=984487 RepID=A0A1E4SJL0_9ASCO|nr:23S ribosomal RNA methyltransferase [Suhomyces tanzawaensis NRRL Y-17324]ODV79689.1 23S ribosomal RNA methyltransferase [Suhomyces tanzawaensis NRRL Y-17324]
MILGATSRLARYRASGAGSHPLILWGGLRQKSNSSGRWLERQSNDAHTKQAKTEYYRSRAAYKLIEIDKKYKLFSKRTTNIVDLGFAPGAWTQVAIERMKKLGHKSRILGVDLISCSAPQGSHFIQGDILSRKTHQDIQQFFSEEEAQPVDLVLSDMMANTSGIKDNDHFASMDLCDGAMILSCHLLKEGGSLVMKFYTGKEDQVLLKKMQKMFKKVYRMKPDACRDELREMYIIGVRKNQLTVQELFGE